MSKESREEQFKAMIKSKEKEKSLPDGILLKIYDKEKEFLAYEHTRSEAIKDIMSIISTSLPEDIEKLKAYNKTFVPAGDTNNGN
jgi:methanogenic corrinoid protein MtbC1